MPRLKTPEADGCKRPINTSAVAPRTDRHLLVDALANAVAARILDQHRRSATSLDAARISLEKPSGQLRDRGLAGTDRTAQRDDRAAPEGEVEAVDDRMPGGVRKPYASQPADLVTGSGHMTVRGETHPARPMPRKPGPRRVGRSVEHDTTSVEEQDAVCVIEHAARSLLGDEH